MRGRRLYGNIRAPGSRSYLQAKEHRQTAPAPQGRTYSPPQAAAGVQRGPGAVKSLRETNPETGAQPRANFRQIQRAYYPIGGGPAGICRNLHSAAGAYPLPGLDQTGSGNAGRRQGPRSAARLTIYRPGPRSIALRELPQLRPLPDQTGAPGPAQKEGDNNGYFRISVKRAGPQPARGEPTQTEAQKAQRNGTAILA